MDEIAELREALDRLHTLFEELMLRGLRSAGAKEITRLTNIRDEFLTAGAAHIADRLTTLLNAIESGFLCPAGPGPIAPGYDTHGR